MAIITVISTGFNAPTKRLCIESVKRQTGVEVDHRYVDAGEQDVPQSAGVNQAASWATLPPDRPVVFLDGDDWLPHAECLSMVARAHAHGAWVTYGSYITSAGDKGIAAPYAPTEDVRTSEWRATHLKSVRAGLLHRIDFSALAHPGALVAEPDCWPWDMMIMMPAIEMAGWDRTVFLRNILYVYHEANSWERTNPEKVSLLRHREAIVRGMPTCERLDSL